MDSSRSRDILAGILLVGFGVAYTAQAVIRYGLGTFAAMRPGMFPTLVGSALVIAGLVVLVPAVFRRRPSDSVEPVAWRPLVAILGAMAVFAFAVGRIGLVPSIFVLTGLAVLADDKLGPIATLVLATVIAVLAVLIFRYALGFPMVLVRSPF